MPKGKKHNGKVLPCEKDSASLLVQISRKEDNLDVDDGVRFVVTPPQGPPIVVPGAPRQRIFEHLAPGKYVVSVEFESPRPRYVLDGKPSKTYVLKAGDFEFAIFKSK